MFSKEVLFLGNFSVEIVAPLFEMIRRYHRRTAFVTEMLKAL
jgi:hypothetical protein